MLKNMHMPTLYFCFMLHSNGAYGEEIVFPKGTMSSVIRSKTVEGEQTYQFHATQGQEALLTFLSLDKYASFSLSIKNHSRWVPIANAEKHWNGYLPQSENDVYHINIKSTESGTPFELFVGAKPRDKAPQMIDYKEGIVQLSMGEKRKKIDLSSSISGCIMAYDNNPENRKDASELQLIDSVPIDNHYYVVFLAYSSGNCNILGQCGAGLESDIIWMELNKDLSVSQKKSVSIDGCRYSDSSLISSTNPFGYNEGYSFTPLMITENGFKVTFEKNRHNTKKDYVHVQLLYMRNMADAGLQIHPKKKKRP